MKKSRLNYLLVPLLVLAMFSCEEIPNAGDVNSLKLTSLSIDTGNSLKVKVTDTLQLAFSIDPVEVMDTAKLTWKSSNPAVATVSASGTLIALTEGTTIISLESATFNKRATTIVTVGKFIADIPLTLLALNKTDFTFTAINSDTLQLSYTYKPDNASMPKVTWSSSNNQVVKVTDKGAVKIIGGGSAIITATALDGSDIYAECKITVPGTGIKDARYDSGDSYYQIVYEPITITVTLPDGTQTTQTWLDRNLGAHQVATTTDDYLAFGSFFQWGRNADGHEKVTWQLGSDNKWTASASTVSTDLIANRLVTANTNFITSAGDWSTDTYGATNGLWGGKQQTISSTAPNYTSINFSEPLSSENQANNPCPPGYRIPTPLEVQLMMNSVLGTTLKYNAVNTVDDALNKLLTCPLHFASTGNRANATGLFGNTNTYLFLWTNTPNSANNAYRFQATNSTAGTRLTAIQKANAYPIRCIKID